jgi:hypothetical protein
MEYNTVCEYFKRTGNCVMRKACPYQHPPPFKFNINAKPYIYKAADSTKAPLFSTPIINEEQKFDNEEYYDNGDYDNQGN